MKGFRLKELLDKYLKDTASEAERQEVEDWYESFESKEGLTGHLTEEQNKQIQNKLQHSINERIDAELYNSYQEESDDGKFKKVNFKTSFAAASISLVIALFWYRNTVNNTVEVKKAEWAEIKAEKSEVKKVVLPDGSIVWINASSSIRFERNFHGKIREVWLEGEGYFDVVHDTSKAFEVHAGALTSHVLGTTFNISAYKSDKRAAITVISGKVAVANGETGLAVLNPDQQIIYNKESEEFLVSRSQAADIMAWTDGKLIFKDETLEEIALKLERWYNINIRFSNKKLQGCRLTASFDTDIPVDNVLKMLVKVSGNKKVKKEDAKNYLISGKPCKEP